MKLATLIAIGVMLAFTGQARAELVELEVKSTEPAFAGRTFGSVGAYELIRAVAHHRVDPAAPVNAGLVNIQKAPRDAQGRVAFDADVVILKPVDLAKGNGRMLYEMVNRGRSLSVGLLNRVAPGAGRGSFSAAAEAGDGFLMDAGFTVVMSGWQAEYPVTDAPPMAVALGSRLPRPPSSTALSARLPVAADVTGMTREQFFDVGAEGTFVGYLSYPAADVNEKGTMAMRERDADPAVSPASLAWRYLDPWRIEVTKPAGTSPGALFEFVYRAKDPVVYGLALASMRDLVSYLRYGDAEGNPLRSAIKKVIGLGASQTGRTLKELVSEFNEDESGRIVLDGANIVISGAGRNSVNSAFARPGLKDAQHTSWGLRGDEFPFSYPVTRDALSGRTDGVIRRCSATRTCPRIVHIDSENELWHGGTLTYVDASGRDLTMPDNVRVFVFAGTEHTSTPRPGMSPPFCAAPAPAMIDWSVFARALFTALDRWVANDEAPPASRYPTVARGELVAKSAYNFPKLYEAPYVGAFSAKHYYDFSHEPPKRIGSYPLLVPQADADGLMIGGIRHPFVSVPLATNAGWNVRKPGFGEGDLCMATGLHVPFAATRQERAERKDPRLSIEERYASRDAYVQSVKQAAQALVKDRLLLPADAEAIVAEADDQYHKALARR
ncbi:alpha/beta hydrolase domain-containing protein [Peristeroidobacter agariperforans]|uniref:alpha/beta hydrolase domain-containing protein n=1 Tax=Peristeroidobacter agariperforans TaxID=268404 RepID=UPI00101C5FCA|nr:alpha/beta hydrolase domain-containing protein [Peristeroidobacter agariperforans]